VDQFQRLYIKTPVVATVRAGDTPDGSVPLMVRGVKGARSALHLQDKQKNNEQSGEKNELIQHHASTKVGCGDYELTNRCL